MFPKNNYIEKLVEKELRKFLIFAKKKIYINKWLKVRRNP